MRELLLAHWPLKLSSLAIAFVIWASITGENPTLKDFTVPLEARLGPERIAAEPPPTTVTVRLEGPAPILRKLDPLKLGVHLDLLSAPLGEREIQLSETNLDWVPPGTQVAFFDPERVRLVLDTKLRRRVVVKPELTGAVADDLQVYHTLVKPDRLIVEGPASVVGPLDGVRTEPILLDGRRKTFAEIVRAIPEGAQVRLVDPSELEVTVVIDEKAVDMTFEDVPLILTTRAGVEAMTSTPLLNVTLSGPQSTLHQIDRARILAVADALELEPGRRLHRIPVRATLVDLQDDQAWRIDVKSIVPEQISVRLAERSASPS